MREHGLPSPRSARDAWRCAMFALSLKSEAAYHKAERLSVEVDAVMRHDGMTHAGERRARAGSRACAGAAAAPTVTAAPCCRHLDLRKLAACPRYRFTLEELALLPVEELNVLLSDPEVSYACPLAVRL
jgi:hypothetical protein